MPVVIKKIRLQHYGDGFNEEVIRTPEQMEKYVDEYMAERRKDTPPAFSFPLSSLVFGSGR